MTDDREKFGFGNTCRLRPLFLLFQIMVYLFQVGYVGPDTDRANPLAVRRKQRRRVIEARDKRAVGPLQ